MTPTAHELRAAFDTPAPLTVGVEEELMLLDPETLDLVPRGPEVLERLDGDPRFKLELPASQLEIVAPPLPDAAAVADFLRAARQDLAEGTTGLVRPAGAGLHPFASPQGELNPGERYEFTKRMYGPVAVRQLVCALQVHVAVRGADRALAVHDALRSYLPEISALAANSPFYEGRDTGMASARPKVAELLPRQGVPPALGSWEALSAALDWGVRAGAMREHRSWWWELRPNPAFGTLEVRVPDAQARVEDVAGVVELVRALVVWLAARHDAGELPPPAPTWRIEENRWFAAHRGLEGELADLETGARVPTRDRLRGLMRETGAGPVAERLLDSGGGAAAQRAAAREGGPEAAARDLAERFLA